MADTIHFNKFYVSKNSSYSDNYERIFRKKQDPEKEVKPKTKTPRKSRRKKA